MSDNESEGSGEIWSTYRRATSEWGCHMKQGSCDFSQSREEKEEAGVLGEEEGPWGEGTARLKTPKLGCACWMTARKGGQWHWMAKQDRP